MNIPEFTTTLIVDQSPEQVFAAAANVRGWWSEEIEGHTDRLNAEFKYHYEDVHNCRMRITEFIPDEKIVWHVLDNYFKFTQDKSEWINTTVSFEITEKGDRTELKFTHHGLVPEYECFEVCCNAWTNYIQKSLRNLITTGKGMPNSKEVPRTEHEKVLNSAK